MPLLYLFIYFLNTPISLTGLLHILPPFSFHFLPSRLSPIFLTCLSLLSSLWLFPNSARTFTPQCCLYESRSDSLSPGLPLVMCAAQNRIKLCWACSPAAPIPGENRIFYTRWISELFFFFKPGWFLFWVELLSLLRYFYCIIRRQGQQWSGLTVWARPVLHSSSSPSLCVFVCLSYLP